MSTVKGGKEVMPQLQANLENLGLKPHERQSGRPTIIEYRLQLPKDPAARAIVEQAVTSSLLLATTVGGGKEGGSLFVGSALRQVFDAAPKNGFAHDIILQIASVPIRTFDDAGKPAAGVTLRAAFKTTAVED